MVHAGYLLGAAVFVFNGAAGVLGIVALAAETWLRVESPVRVTTRVGLLRTCEGTFCTETEFTRLSICNKFGSDVSTRMNSAVAFLSIAAILHVIAAVIGCRELFFAKPIGGTTYLEPHRVRVASVLVERAHVPWVATATAILAAASMAAGFVIQHIVFDSWLNCGAPLCDTFVARDSAASCMRGESFVVGMVAVACAAIGFVVCIAWGVLTSRLLKRVSPRMMELVELRQKQRAGSRGTSIGSTQSIRPSNRRPSTSTGEAVRPGTAATEHHANEPAEHSEATSAVSGRGSNSTRKVIVVEGGEERAEGPAPMRASSSVFERPQEDHQADAAGDDAEAPLTGCGLAGDWVESERSLWWSESERLFYDTASGNFFDPASDQWYNPRTEQWFMINDQGDEQATEHAPPAPGADRRSSEHQQPDAPARTPRASPGATPSTKTPTAT